MSVAGKRLEIPNPPIRLISAETKLARKAELNEAQALEAAHLLFQDRCPERHQFDHGRRSWLGPARRP